MSPSAAADRCGGDPQRSAWEHHRHQDQEQLQQEQQQQQPPRPDRPNSIRRGGDDAEGDYAQVTLMQRMLSASIGNFFTSVLGTSLMAVTI